MKCLYLMRHGTAAHLEPGDKKPLTSTGREEVSLCAERFKQRLQATDWPALSQVVSSDLLRARQTAEIMAESLGWTGQLQLNNCLMPNSLPAEVEQSLPHEVSGWLLVSHQPLLRAMVGYLCDQDVYQETAWLVVLEGEIFGQGLWQLREVIEPR